jgi:predicted ATP-grasp superfamily ATP-dependent carboligase
VPTTILYQTESSIEKNLSLLTFPVLIKPVKGNGGIGIKFFDDPVSLSEHCRNHVKPDEYIIQSFVHGYDVGCSILSLDGKIMASTMQKRSINLPMTFSPFTNIDFFFDSNIYQIAETIIHKLNWSGVAHFDLRYDENENNYTVLEMNPRFWQSIVGSFYAGANFPYLSAIAGLKRDLPEVIFKSIYYVNPNTAIKIRFQSLYKGESEIRSYDGSKLESHLKDPLPLIFSKSYDIYKHRLKPVFKKLFNKTPGQTT